MPATRKKSGWPARNRDGERASRRARRGPRPRGDAGSRRARALSRPPFARQSRKARWKRDPGRGRIRPRGRGCDRSPARSSGRPGRRAATMAVDRGARGHGIHCSTRVARREIELGVPAAVADVAVEEGQVGQRARRARLPRPRATISSLTSSPTTRPGSTRRAVSMVSVPGPQPTSSTSRPGAEQREQAGMAVGERARGHDARRAGGHLGAIPARNFRRAPPPAWGARPRCTRAPGPMTVVDSRSSTMAGPSKRRARRERVAVVDRRVDVAARLREVRRRVLLARASTAAGRARPVHPAGVADLRVRARSPTSAPVQRLDGDAERGAAVERAVGGLERRGDGRRGSRARAAPAGTRTSTSWPWPT